MDFELFIKKIKEKGFAVECSFGCEFLGYTCAGNPETAGCPCFIVKDKEGKEWDIDKLCECLIKEEIL